MTWDKGEGLKEISKVIYPFIFNLLILELSPFGIKVSVNCPPDTNTPGFANEQATKPEETALICEGAGLFNPEQVARYRFQLPYFLK